MDLLKARSSRPWAPASCPPTKVAKVSIVGIGMRSHVGVASLMFQTLSQEGINIQMISTSEIKTSVIIDDKYMELACARCTRPSAWTRRPPPRPEEQGSGANFL